MFHPRAIIEGNVVSCTVDINGKKSNLSDDEIELLYTKIVLHKKKSIEEPKGMEILTPDGSYLPEEGTTLLLEELLLDEVQTIQEDQILEGDSE